MCGVRGVSEGKGGGGVCACYTETLHCPLCIPWCPYFMHCELNHVGPVTSDDATCFFSEIWVCSFAASCPSPPPLPSHSSHPPCGGVVSGGGGVVGVPSRSEVAAYHARDTTATPAEGCVYCCTSPCASLCVLLCCVTRLSSLQHCSIPRTDHHSPTRTASNSCQPWTALRPVDCTFAARSGR